MTYEIVNEDGHAVAWLSRDTDCANSGCKRSIREGRTVHIVPAHSDPRAAEFTLSLPTYHFRTIEEAYVALEEAWANAETVDNSVDRDSAYARNVPVKIRKDGHYV